MGTGHGTGARATIFARKRYPPPPKKKTEDAEDDVRVLALALCVGHLVRPDVVDVLRGDDAKVDVAAGPQVVEDTSPDRVGHKLLALLQLRTRERARERGGQEIESARAQTQLGKQASLCERGGAANVRRRARVGGCEVGGGVS